jgi:hypothetical protein
MSQQELSLADVLARYPAPRAAEPPTQRQGKVIVLDDDPTGTQTVHDVPVYTDWRPERCAQIFAEEAPAVFILTNSRGLSVAETAAVHREIARNLWGASRETAQPFLLVSRSDSTLRGHWPLETETLRETLKDTGDRLILPEPTANSNPSWFGFPIMCRAGVSRNRLVRSLEEKGIQTRMLFAGNIARQPCMQGAEYRRAGELTNTDRIMNDLFWIGVYPGLDENALDYMADTIVGLVK